MSDVEFPQAYHDFYKTNGGEYDTHTPGPSLTRQEFADECDINVIMARYEKTGQLPANNAEPMYVDFTSVPTNLMDTMRFMDEAQAAFMTLPAKVRKEFDNDPAMFVDFAGDPENLDQMRAWGLAPTPEAKPADASASSSPPGGAGASPAPQAAPQAAPEGASSTVTT